MATFKRVIMDGEYSLPVIPLFCSQHVGIDIFHEGKTNHMVSLSFKVLESDKKIKFYHISTDEFEKFALQANSAGGNIDPTDAIFKSGKVHSYDGYDIPIHESTRLHFVFSKYGAKVPFKVTIVESWENDKKIIKILPGIPITNNQLSKRIKQLISESKTSLKIISPHTDLHLFDDISEAVKRGVNVELIIRNLDQQNTAPTQQAFPYLQKILGKNLKSNTKIHTRLIIKDNSEAIIMSSDIDQNSMQNLINCGIEISDSTPISELNNFFKEIWLASHETSGAKRT